MLILGAEDDHNNLRNLLILCLKCPHFWLFGNIKCN